MNSGAKGWRKRGGGKRGGGRKQMIDKETHEVAAMKLALEALKEPLGFTGSSGIDAKLKGAIKALEAALEAHKALAKQEQKRPQNCGTSYCSCIECVMDEQEQGEPVAAEREAIAVWLEKECDEQYLADRVRARGLK